MPATIIPGIMPTLPVGQARIGIYHRCFDLVSNIFYFNSVPVDNVCDIKARASDVLNALSLQVQRIFIVILQWAAFNVLEDAVTLTFAYVKGLSVTGID